MAGADRLSGLSDDLLASVISFLPASEAVRTAALSRRWRLVWLRTDNLLLDSRFYSEYPWATNDRLVSDAGEFLGAAGRCNHVRKLSLSVHGRDAKHLESVMGNTMWGARRDSYDLMASLLAAPPLRSYLEEVRVKLEVIKRGSEEEQVHRSVYRLDPVELPGHTLRVLDLEYCRLESPPDGAGAAAVSFPLLSSLRLYNCSSSTKDLESWIHTAASLNSLHIQDHNFYCRSDDNRFNLHSPSLTTLTLVPGSRTRQRIELDVPSLRAFKYNGEFQATMKSETTELVRADLTVKQIYSNNGSPVQTWFAPFWKLLRNCRHAKAIKLKVPAIEGITVDKDMQHEHLFTLPYLERLELRGFSDPGRRDDAALAIANLLQCCLVIHDLRIQIPTDPYRTYYVDRSIKVRLSDFDVAMDVFSRRFSKEMVVPLVLDPDDYSSQVVVLPGLTGFRFPCLQNHLKSVMLQFESKKLNSFEVCLAKFLAENCMVLEVLQIDDGKQTFVSHLNWMVERWRANAPKQRTQMECFLRGVWGRHECLHRLFL
ncbi:unnamed protein product [Alopecurus aequalis]